MPDMPEGSLSFRVVGEVTAMIWPGTVVPILRAVAAVVIERAGLDALIRTLMAEGYRVVGPTSTGLRPGRSWNRWLSSSVGPWITR